MTIDYVPWPYYCIVLYILLRNYSMSPCRINEMCLSDGALYCNARVFIVEHARRRKVGRLAGLQITAGHRDRKTALADKEEYWEQRYG